MLPQSDLENPPKTSVKVTNIPSLDLHPGPLWTEVLTLLRHA